MTYPGDGPCACGEVTLTGTYLTETRYTPGDPGLTVHARLDDPPEPCFSQVWPYDQHPTQDEPTATRGAT